MRRAVSAAALVAALALVAGCSEEPHPAGGDHVEPGSAQQSAAQSSGAAQPSGGAASTTPAAPSAAPGTTFTVAFAGDVHFESRTESRLNVKAPEQALGPISKKLADADLSVLNLETAITERGAPEAKTYTFRTPARTLKVLQDSGVDVVSMANNHAVDFGQPGLTDTLAAKASSPIPVVGFGKDATEAFAPYLADVKGVKVAVLGASQVNEETNKKWRAGVGKAGIASALDEPALIKAVEQAKAQASVVLVYLHWGDEGKACPTAAQTSIAKKLADAGATAVVGTHAHTMLGAGMLGDTYVGYGFGNFLWYATSSYANSNETGVTTLTVTAEGKVTAEEFTPAEINAQGVPVPETGAKAAASLKRREGLRGCTGLAPVK
ncbi:CapA family protein [Kitasatospora sp. NPDC096147]|uniref:CapA family protein n=1 Tax=Kitasatospora sp. NPDC096147 TaxID=3364093 RepID=UPI003815BDEE